jgi:hypothetical protein
MQNRVNKNDWVAMFKEVGMDEEAMKKWHRLFEARHPESHADFLKWLGLSPDEIARVRSL